jgi:hypothetical protein
MGTLITTPNIARPDAIYQLLMDLHQGLTDEESMRTNARLVLILLNHIGDEQIISEALATARREVTAPTVETPRE